MTFVQIMVLVVVVCVSAVQAVSILAKAAVMKKRVGVPGDKEIAGDVVGAMLNADKSGATVRIMFNECGTTILYFPKGTDDEPVQVGD